MLSFRLSLSPSAPRWAADGINKMSHNKLNSLSGMFAVRFFLAVALGLVLGSATFAATFTVTKVNDTNDGVCDADCSLREAIAAANTAAGDDSVVFDPAVFSTARTIALTSGHLPVCNNGSLSVNGRSADQLIVSGNNLSRVFRVFPGATATLNNLTIADGNTSFGPFTGCPPVSGGDASFGGAGIENAGTLFINNSVIRNNVTNSGSAAGISNASGNVTLTNSIVRNNRAGLNYGGVANFGFGTSLPVTFTIVNSQIIHNEATGENIDGGGGVGNLNMGTMSISNSVISFNTTGSTGGGVRNSVGTLTITNSIISGNTASGGGGGLHNNFGNGTVSIVGSTISGNNAPGTTGGGGIFNTGSTVTLTNSTVSGNMAAGNGGGLLGNFFQLVYTTIAFNQANGCGGVCTASGVSARNSIIARNVAANSPDFTGELTSMGYNLIGNTSGMVISGGPEDIVNVDPLLGPLANNGGPTNTHALLLGSPAIDKASAVAGITTDQRGRPRPADRGSVPNAPGGNGSDIGAFETPGGAAPFDFDGDRKTDVGIFRPHTLSADWWINRSSTGETFALRFGAPTYPIVPADYTGDGKVDIAYFIPFSGEWFVLRSEDFSFFSVPFGAHADIPAPADYDADGKADFAVFRPSSSTWYISQSSGAPTRIFQFGSTGDAPVVADYDADGKADVGIFRQATGGAEWWIDRSSAGLLAMQFGANTDKAVQGDYTGDGKADIAIWRPSTGQWLIVRSEDFSFYGFPFGINGDVVAPGDYDGDGKFDATIFRPSNALWFISRTSAGIQIVQFGADGDRPLPNAFVP